MILLGELCCLFFCKLVVTITFTSEALMCLHFLSILNKLRTLSTHLKCYIFSETGSLFSLFLNSFSLSTVLIISRLSFVFVSGTFQWLWILAVVEGIFQNILLRLVEW